MVWFTKKVGGMLLISQLILGSGEFLVNGDVTESSSEIVENAKKKDQESNVGVPETIETETSGDIESKNHAVVTEDTNQTSSSVNDQKEHFTKESKEAAEEETNESEAKASVQNIETQATGSGATAEDPRIVETSTELRSAIEVDKVPFIKLADSTEIFQFEKASNRIKITYNVTIDGNNRTLSYSDNGGYYAMEVGQANVTVKLKNMTFGSPDYSVKAYDYYGFCRGQGNSNTTIQVENVNYYSNAAAQPFHNDGSGSKIEFYGTNYFSVQNGAYSQEFAEGNNFIFEEGSHTTVDHNTGYTNSINTSSSNDFNFELKDRAVVDYSTTSNNFVSSFGNNGNVTVGKEASLNLNGTRSFSALAEKMNVQILEKGAVELTFANKFDFDSNSIFGLAKDSILNMKVTNSDQIFNKLLSTENFVIDNAYRLSFGVSGTSNKEPINAGFTFKDFVGDVTGYGLTADNQPISTTIANKDTITSNGTNFTLGNTEAKRDDFTDNEKTAIRGAKSIVLQRLPNPAVILGIKQTIKDMSAEFNLSDYLTNQNMINGVVYKLFDSKQTIDNFDSALDTKEVKDPITSVVAFDNLTEEKDYWLYVQIETGFATGYSEWYEVPFTTKSSVLSVTIPTSMFFNTEMTEDQHLNVYSSNYALKNNSAYPLDIALSSFTEEEQSDIELLDRADPGNSNGLLLQLNLDNNQLPPLKTDLSNVAMGKLAIDEQADLRFTGEYFGSAGKEIKVKYNMTLNFKKAED